MEIKVGQIWETRGGKKVTIISEMLDSPFWRWQGDLGNGEVTKWTDKGKYWINENESNLDLIKLIKDVEEPKMKQIEVGQKWKLVNGETAIVVKRNIGNTYPWVTLVGSTTHTYTHDGRYCVGNPCPSDLDTLITEPKLYSKENIEETFQALGISPDFNIFFAELDKFTDSEYKEYLRLKEKFN